jgi:hypothetical protein
MNCIECFEMVRYDLFGLKIMILLVFSSSFTEP